MAYPRTANPKILRDLFARIEWTAGAMLLDLPDYDAWRQALTRANRSNPNIAAFIVVAVGRARQAGHHLLATQLMMILSDITGRQLDTLSDDAGAAQDLARARSLLGSRRRRVSLDSAFVAPNRSGPTR